MSYRIAWKRQQLLARLHDRRCSTQPGSNSKFDVSLVNANYVDKAQRAAQAHLKRDNVAFRMVLPPPNVTGQLHLGHALTVTVEDAIVRQQRLFGRSTQWIPGFDHAGIATQSVVEKMLWKEKRLRRIDLSREEFVEECKKWAKRNSNQIAEQLKRLGASLDWTSQYYTLDERFSRAVSEAFCRLHEDGLIARGKQFVHWCPSLQTALSDQEVNRVEAGQISIPSTNGGTRTIEAGVMYKVCYGTMDNKWIVEVGTTRPETCFADVALAVHPDDPRHAHLIGTLIQHPLLDRQMPVVADRAVLIDKGTGIVKLTPEHDRLDADIVSRHLDEITTLTSSCIDEHGLITPGTHPKFDGLDRFDARNKVVKLLEDLNRGGTKMKHENAQVMICSRSGDVIEPRLMKQWNLDVKPLHAAALQAIERGKLKVAPMGQTQRVIDWLENMDPWCLSRQLYWGHRIPAFTTGDVTDESEWTIARDSKKAATALGCHVEDLRQESDVLDTWFSSSLVPLVVSGWCSSSTSTTIPHFTSPPLNIMETGHDIIGFWVTRMIAMTLHLTNGTLPFSSVFLHGLVRDSSGRKMSKSLGNVIDPLDVLDGISLEQMLKRLDESNLDKQEIGLAKEDLRKNYPNGIPKSGADALRFALLRHDVSATDVPIAVSKLIDEGLRFCNKLWNLTNYALILRNSSSRNFTDTFTNETDLWLLSRLHGTLIAIDDHMEKLSLSNAFLALFDFLIGDLCDVYLETTKKCLWSKDQARINEVCSVLNHILPRSLAQLSIFMPFAAQAMYERIKTPKDRDFYDFILKQEPNRVNPALDTQMRFTLSIVSTIRSLRAQLNLPKTISFDGFLLSNESPRIHPLFNELNSLCGLRLLQEPPSSSKEYVIYPVHGYDAQLNIKIQDENREEFNRLLEKQNEHINQRIKKQTEVVKGANQMAERDANDTKAKSDKKDRSARRAKSEMVKLEGLRAESKRLQTLVDKQKNLIK